MRRALRWFFVGAILATSCSRSEPDRVSRAYPCDEADARPVDQGLLAWLSKARALHQLADIAENDGAIDRALTPLEQLVGGAPPSGDPQEAKEVMADTYARIAELRVRRGDFARADDAVEAGLKYAPGRDYFRGHLLEVRGLVAQKHALELEKTGKTDEARRAREKGAAASLEAVRIQDEVIRSTLGAAGPRERD